MAQFRVLVTRWPRVTKTNDAGKIVESVEHHFNDVIELPDDVAEWALPAGIVEPYVAGEEADGPKLEPVVKAAGPGEDTKPEPGPYDGLSGDELKALCKDRNLPVRGSKPELIARLVEADEAAKQDGDQGDGDHGGDGDGDGDDTSAADDQQSAGDQQSVDE